MPKPKAKGRTTGVQAAATDDDEPFDLWRNAWGANLDLRTSRSRMCSTTHSSLAQHYERRAFLLASAGRTGAAMTSNPVSLSFGNIAPSKIIDLTIEPATRCDAAISKPQDSGSGDHLINTSNARMPIPAKDMATEFVIVFSALVVPRLFPCQFLDQWCGTMPTP